MGIRRGLVAPRKPWSARAKLPRGRRPDIREPGEAVQRRTPARNADRKHVVIRALRKFRRRTRDAVAIIQLRDLNHVPANSAPAVDRKTVERKTEEVRRTVPVERFRETRWN